MSEQAAVSPWCTTHWRVRYGERFHDGKPFCWIGQSSMGSNCQFEDMTADEAHRREQEANAT